MAYIGRMSGAAAQTKANNLYVIRSFLRHLAAEGMCDPSVPASMPVIPGHKHSALPSAYGGDEVAAALATDASDECPKRNYAMLLCASLMGMRTSAAFASTTWTGGRGGSRSPRARRALG